MDHERIFDALYFMSMSDPFNGGAKRYWDGWCADDSYQANEFERYLKDHPLSKALEKRVRIREVIRKLEQA